MSIFVPVENVLKYAVLARLDAPVVVQVKRQGDMVVVQTENAIKPDTAGKGSGLGMGLDNLREQLAILTQADFSLDTSKNGDRFWVILKFPESQFARHNR